MRSRKKRLELVQGFTKQILRESPSYSEGARQISASLEQIERQDFKGIQSANGELTLQRVLST